MTGRCASKGKKGKRECVCVVQSKMHGTSHNFDGADAGGERRRVPLRGRRGMDCRSSSGTICAVVEYEFALESVDFVEDPVQQVGVADHFPQIKLSVVVSSQGALGQLGTNLADI
ncbi:YJR115W-like protein [Saccharomyces cerevisiae x Saccharomyces kudriavzevii VIN7]|uniref:YJR115W-like protein n=1 Tax=Saccharomyces cerevisiae x Saccharomyces kudriavzevii (strain VIN7) TaxID=1095631 RepID=H0GX52_SACCK|nr:YJR115W-like protein [Saccharomyces cerevisiae x Saccharomyces kudriavzevii VIN7]